IVALVFFYCVIFFFFQAEDGIRDRNVTGVQTCALPISIAGTVPRAPARRAPGTRPPGEPHPYAAGGGSTPDTARRIKVAGCFCWRDTFSMRVPTKRGPLDRKSTRLNSSHVSISYAVFCLKKKKKN